MTKKFYYFPPWRKQFFFSVRLFTEKSSHNFFYHPYILISKVIWGVWSKSSLFRFFFKVDSSQIPELFHIAVKKLSLGDYIFQVNVGTTGAEQKMTILAYSQFENKFVKAGCSNTAMLLIKNEAATLKLLNGNLGVPIVQEVISDNESTILSTSVVHGEKLKNTELNSDIFSYIISIGEVGGITINNNLKCCLAHGDCCPWNFLTNSDGKLILIDWELSKIYPIGYDLLTFIFQTAFLLQPKKLPIDTFDENLNWIIKYFKKYGLEEQMNNYINYFIDIKISNEIYKGDSNLIKQWRSLKDLLIEKL